MGRMCYNSNTVFTRKITGKAGQGMKKYGKWSALCVCLLWCAVIWQFSLAQGSASAATSGRVLALCNGALEKIGAPFTLTAVAVRKMAHFAEFFVLGCLATLTLRMHGFGHPYLQAPAFCLLVATVDELIQCFVPDRGPHILDVLLDLGGACAGVLAFWAVEILLLYIKKKRFEKSVKTT